MSAKLAPTIGYQRSPVGAAISPRAAYSLKVDHTMPYVSSPMVISSANSSWLPEATTTSLDSQLPDLAGFGSPRVPPSPPAYGTLGSTASNSLHGVGNPTRTAVNAAALQDLRHRPQGGYSGSQASLHQDLRYRAPGGHTGSQASLHQGGNELSPRVINGALVMKKPRMTPLDALLSLASEPPSDVSYLSDRPGHGCGVASRGSLRSDKRRVSPRAPSFTASPRSTRYTQGGRSYESADYSVRSACTPVHPGATSAASLTGCTDVDRPTTTSPRKLLALSADAASPTKLPNEDDTVPSSRVQAVATAEWLRKALYALEVGEHEDAPEDDLPNNLSSEVKLWDDAFSEVVRQVKVHCQERGQLLDAIRLRYANVLQALLASREAIRETIRKEYEQMLSDKTNEEKDRAKVMLLFHRAAAAGMMGQYKEASAESDEERKQKKIQHKMEVDDLKTKNKVLLQRLNDAIAGQKAAEDQLNSQPTSQRVIAQIDRLSPEDQQTLSYILLSGTDLQGNARSRHPSRALLCTERDATSTSILAALLDPLGSEKRCSILLSLIDGLNANEREQLLKLLLRGLGSHHESRGAVVAAVACLFTEQEPPEVLSSSLRHELASSVFSTFGARSDFKAPELLQVLDEQGLTSKGPKPRFSRQESSDAARRQAGMQAELERLRSIVESQQQILEGQVSQMAVDDEQERKAKLAAAAEEAEAKGNDAVLHMAELEVAAEETKSMLVLTSQMSMDTVDMTHAELEKCGEFSEAEDLRKYAETIPKISPGSMNVSQSKRAALSMSAAIIHSYSASLAAANETIDELRAQLSALKRRSIALGPQTPNSKRISVSGQRGPIVGPTGQTLAHQSSSKGISLSAVGLGDGTFGLPSKHAAREMAESDAIGAAHRGGAAQNTRRGSCIGGAVGVGQVASQSLHSEPVAQSLRGNARAAHQAPSSTFFHTEASDEHEDGACDATGERWPNSAGFEADFGGMRLRTTRKKPMGIHFLYRLVSHTFSRKIVADRAALAKGLEPESLPNFMVSMMLSDNGMQEKIAKSHLSEMFRGLARYRHASPRLQMFAAFIGLFPNEDMSLHCFEVLQATVDAVAHLLDEERSVTQTRRDQFFLRWGEVSELYVPVRHALLGLQEMLAHEHPDTREVVFTELSNWVAANLVETAAACQTAPKTAVPPCGRLATCRVKVIGSDKIVGGYVHFDLFLKQLWSSHAAFCEKHSAKSMKIFGKYDLNGDGSFSKDEFEQMLMAIDVRLGPSEIGELWQACGGADGDASVDMNFLEAKLYQLGQLHRAASQQVGFSHDKPGSTRDKREGAKASVTAVAAQAARQELDLLTALWESVRDASEAEAETTVRIVTDWSWATIQQMRVLVSRWVKRLRQRHANRIIDGQ